MHAERWSAEDEERRLEALRKYRILDTEDEELFQATVRLASCICETPIAAIAFVDADRQWFKARIGLNVSETPREFSVCAHTILEPSKHLVIEDTRLDERFAEHPFVLNQPYLRFYAGMALVSPDGFALGTLCVMDHHPRKFRVDHHEALETLAQQVMTQLELRRSLLTLGLLESAIQQSREALLIAAAPSEAGADSIVEYANTAFLSMSGYRLSDVLGKKTQHLRCLAPHQRGSELYEHAVQKGHPASFEWVDYDIYGRARYLETNVTPMHDAQGKYTHFVLMSRDMSERKIADAALLHAEALEASTARLEEEIAERMHAERRLVHAASHDSLTNLPNRALFIERVQDALAGMKKSTITSAAVLYLDVDRFKMVNDSLGHMVGDELLVVIAKRLKTCMRSDELLARIGGDEFIILMTEFSEPHIPEMLSKRILSQFSRPFQVAGQEMFVSVSIGIAFMNIEYERSEEVMRDADIAMYRAKKKGRRRYELFSPELHAEAVELLQVETDLRRAVERLDFLVYYQPIISLHDTTIVGFEALVRWRHAERGIIGPDAFIAMAEETGMIIPIGLFVLREACRQCRVWNDAKIQETPITISVNVSAKQLYASMFYDNVMDILEETGLSPELLKIEVTESVIATSNQEAINTLQVCKEILIGIHMDDFGTGYSSLSYLDKLPIGVVKIDQSFISGGASSELSNPDIVHAIMSLSHDLGMSVTAEGVETLAQLIKLRNLGCHYAQGYYFSRPMDAARATAYLQTYMHAANEDLLNGEEIMREG